MVTAAALAALEVADRYRLDLAATGQRTALLLAGLWKDVSLADPVASWEPMLARAVAAFTAGQIVAAAMADAYVDDALQAQRTPRPAAAGVDAAAFAETTSSGGAIEALLRIPAQRVAYALTHGVGPTTAMQAGRGLLAMYARTEIADAGRTATAAAGVARRVSGYVRALRPPSCARCAILAGRHYRYSDGFQRHPHCDCVNVPAENDVAPGLVTDTLAAIRDGKVHGLTAAERQAIDLGADPSQVVNARDGMTTAADGHRYTTTGTTRRGIAGARLIARDYARASGVEPGATYRNFTVSRSELARWQAQYVGLLAEGKRFTRLTRAGRVQTVSYRRARTARASVEDILATSTGPEDAIRVLINNGYLL